MNRISRNERIIAGTDLYRARKPKVSVIKVWNKFGQVYERKLSPDYLTYIYMRSFFFPRKLQPQVPTADVFMETRFNLHNKCFLASRYHDLWDTAAHRQFRDARFTPRLYRAFEMAETAVPMTIDCLRNKTWSRAQMSVNTWWHPVSSDRMPIDGGGLFGAPEACQFRHCQASDASPKILEWRWRRGCQDRMSRWDIRFFEVVAKQNGGCCDMNVHAHGTMREAECSLTWECEVWWRGSDAAKRSVLVGSEGLFLERYARAVAHFYKTRSLIVYSKKQDTNIA